MGDASSIAKDTAAIVAWQNAKEGVEKTRLFNALFRAKAGLIRQLTQKAARAEKTSEDLEDLFQAGAIGFQKALERFEPDRGFSISTYAAWWIRHEVQRVARRANQIALPRIRLTNAERERVILALREDPDVTPEAINVRRSQFEQVKASFGLRYVSDDTPRGAAAVERRLLGDAGVFDGEEMLDEARRIRTLDVVLARVRAGEDAERLGLSHEAYELALEVIRIDEEETIIMSEAEQLNGAAEGNHAPRQKRKYKKRAPKVAKEVVRKPVRTKRKPVRAVATAPSRELDDLRAILIKEIVKNIETLPDDALAHMFAEISEVRGARKVA